MSTIRVNAIQNTNTTDGGIGIDGSGHVTIDGQKLPSAGPLSNRNLIINGAMEVAQRGTSHTTSNYGTVDRFRPSYSGGQITQTQEDMTTSDSPYSLGFRKFFRLQNTTATASPPAASNHRRFLIRLEAQDIANSGWDYTSSSSYITLSMWVRSSVGQTFNWFAQTVDGTQQGYSWDVTLTANTWTKITKSFPGNSNITIDNDNGLGLVFDCGMFWGTDYTDSSKTNDAWSAFSGSARAKDFVDTWATTTNATFDVTGVQLEVGSVATPFEHRSFGDELARCQRYYEKTYNHGDEPGTATSDGFVNCVTGTNGSGTAVMYFRFNTPKRAQPTATFYHSNGTANQWAYSRSGASGTPTPTSGLQETGGRIYLSAGANWTVADVQGHVVADAEL